jgi:hypothetical protein
MSVQPQISLITVRREIEECHDGYALYGWSTSDIDVDNQTFTVFMTSPIDNEKFELEFKFDNYPEWPYLIDFIDPKTRGKGTVHAYPKGKTDSFFHGNGVICHPCSRKSHRGYSGLHQEWNLIGWQTLAGGLINLKSILEAIYIRISDNSFYDGRMAK